MKTLIITAVLSLITSLCHAQEEIIKPGKYIQEKTKYIHVIDGVEYPIYVSKRKNKVYKHGVEILNHVSYYIMMIDPKTGNSYTQLLEMVESDK
ncbi:hypothetical protein [Cellulophaga sp. Asnod2-G02]|uniref:hypothetical protein n=1 Tax=Cellulophaga sp. Asnod2-G02 TaxID=3160572 RepID=UPI00386371FC